jgi:hypothetical protein
LLRSIFGHLAQLERKLRNKLARMNQTTASLSDALMRIKALHCITSRGVQMIGNDWQYSPMTNRKKTIKAYNEHENNEWLPKKKSRAYSP